MTSEHGFRDHDSSDLIDWEEYRKFMEEEGEDEEEHFPQNWEYIEWD